jgi:hypothetical protein
MMIQESMAREAAKWALMYEALKGIEAGDGTMKTARVLMKKADPKMTQSKAMIDLLAFEHLGYIEGVRDGKGKMMEPMAVKITKKGHEYFKRRSDCTAYDEV